MNELYRIEPVVISAEFLYQSEGGEPIGFAVVDSNDVVRSVWPNEEEAQTFLAKLPASRPAPQGAAGNRFPVGL